MRALALVLGVWLAACASTSATGSAVPAARAAPVASAVPTASARLGRELGRDATFADLVRGAQAALRANQRDASAGCLLATTPSGFALEADLMPALDDLPDTPAELDSLLASAKGPMRALTAWGQVGIESPALVVAAFTALDAERIRAPGIALVLTDEGVYLRYSDGPANEADGPLPIAKAVERLLAAPHNAGATLYLSAEAATPLAQLVELLRAVPEERALAFCSVLPLGTRIAAPNAPTVERCDDGLPAPEPGRPEGELDSGSIVAALAPLRSEAQRCLEQAAGPARSGGKLTLAFRIGASGAVEDACVERDSVGADALFACVLESTKKLRFPAPSPAGFVDVRLPLALSARSAFVQRALCAAPTSAAP